jgi:hypothetical protein
MSKHRGRKPLEFDIVDPDGNVHRVENLSKFARERGLNPGNLNSVYHGRVSHCQGWHMPGLNPVHAKFWKKVQQGDPGSCWPWTGTLTEDGYGRVVIGGKRVWSHRVAWEYTHGPLGPDEAVFHHCSNKACCNPAHMYVGSKGKYEFQRVVGTFRKALLERGVPEDRVHRLLAEALTEAA